MRSTLRSRLRGRSAFLCKIFENRPTQTILKKYWGALRDWNFLIGSLTLNRFNLLCSYFELRIMHLDDINRGSWVKNPWKSRFLPDCSDKNNRLLSLSITMYYLINPSTLFLAKNIFFHNQLNQPKLRFEISGYWKFCESVMAAWVVMRRRANQQWRTSTNLNLLIKNDSLLNFDIV